MANPQTCTECGCALHPAGEADAVAKAEARRRRDWERIGAAMDEELTATMLRSLNLEPEPEG